MNVIERGEIHKLWSNWGGNQTCTPALTVAPSSVEEVQEVLRYAARNKLTVRVVGGGHSFTPVVQTGGVLIDLKNLSGIISADKHAKRVRALGGTRLYDFGEPLWEAGLSLSNQGDIDHQTISGAISTATHGSGIGQGSFSSKVTALTIVNGHGDVVEISESSGSKLLAAQVALGTLGVIVEVELEVQDAYFLKETISYETTEELLDRWDLNPLESRHFSFLWCQASESAGLYELPTPDGLDMVGRAYTKRYVETSNVSDADISSVEGARLDRAYKIYPGGFMIPFHELEYYVNSDVAKDAFVELTELIRDKHPDQKYPIETRWTKGDSGLISPFLGHDKVSLSVSGAPGTNYWPYLKDVDRLLEKYAATSHWGKIHFMTRERAERLFPEIELFREIRESFDPNGIFLNDHTSELFSRKGF